MHSLHSPLGMTSNGYILEKKLIPNKNYVGSGNFGSDSMAFP